MPMLYASALLDGGKLILRRSPCGGNQEVGVDANDFGRFVLLAGRKGSLPLGDLLRFGFSDGSQKAGFEMDEAFLAGLTLPAPNASGGETRLE